MAPKKKETQKFSLGEFMNESPAFSGSWADEVEDTFASGTQPLPPAARGASSYGGGDRGYSSIRENLPQKLPDKPPFTAHLGNLSYDATVESVTDFFAGCNIVNVRIIEDREQNRPKGFAYAEFADLEGLKQALTLDGQSFQGRSIRIKVADPPKERYGNSGGESTRDLSDWSRKGPLPPAPRAGGERRGSGPDFSERRPREFGSGADDGRVRDYNTWERRGPLSPLPQAERPAGSRDGSRARTMEDRSGSVRNRRASPAWGPSAGDQEGSRPPRREFVERPERVATAAEKDTQWRSNMRPDPPAKSPGPSREGSEAPPSPAGPPPAQPAGRPKLNLTKRTVSEAPAVTSPSLSAAGDAKASPFGAARPIDTATRERQIEEKRLLSIKQKKEADDKAKEDRRLAKEAAAKEAAEKAAADKEAAEKAAEVAAEKAAADKEAADKEAEAEAAAAATTAAAAAAEPEAKEETPATPTTAARPQNGEKTPSQRPHEPAFKSRASESGNWRQSSAGSSRGGRGGNVPSGPRRGGDRPPRGPRGGERGDRGERGGGEAGRNSRVNGSSGASQSRQPSQSAGSDSAAPATTDADGWTVVPNKNRRGGQNPRPLAS